MNAALRYRSFGLSPILLALFLGGCGGSTSETPMPLEPVPHQGPEPAEAEPKEGASEKETAVEAQKGAPAASAETPAP